MSKGNNIRCNKENGERGEIIIMIGMDTVFIYLLILFAIFIVLIKPIDSELFNDVFFWIVVIASVSTLVYSCYKIKADIEEEIIETKNEITTDIQRKSKYIYVKETVLNKSGDDVKDMIKTIMANGYVPTYQIGRYKVYRLKKNKK